MENVDPFLQVYYSVRTDIPNITYINMLEFLVKEIELQVELGHLMSVVRWASAFNGKFNAGLTSSHQIFGDETQLELYENMAKESG